MVIEQESRQLPHNIRHLYSLQSDLNSILKGRAPLHQNEWQARDFDILTFQPKIARDSLPGLKEGVYLERPDFAARMIPDSDLYGRIVYANCKGYEELKNGTFEKIRSLATGLKLRDRYDIKVQHPLLDESFSPDNIINALKVVEKSMEGQERRTGEESFTHILRTVLQATELISLNNSEYNKGKIIVPFTGRTAELLLLLCALHDFAEEDTPNDGKEKTKFGELDENITILPDGKYRVTFHSNTEGVGDLNLLLDQNQLFPLINGIRALNSSGMNDEAQFALLQEIPLRSHQTLPLRDWRDHMLYFLPYLVKILDRLDNLRTYQFVADEDYHPFWNRRKPQSKEKIISKMNSTIDFFERAENYLAFMMTDFSRKRSNAKALASGILFLFTHDWCQETFLNRQIARFRPSRLAMEILMGMSPAEIFRENNWNRPGPWILQPV